MRLGILRIVKVILVVRRVFRFLDDEILEGGAVELGVELKALTNYAKKHGMANTCRAILNLNEFVFVD